MKSRFRPVLAALAGSSILVLAPPSSAENPAHAQLVIDGTTSLGPMQGGAHGVWTAPSAGDGDLYAKLYDSQGVERFILDAALIQYVFIVAAPAQGEIHGLLLVAPPGPMNGVSTVPMQIYATVEGMWIETSGGRGAFHASILPFGAPGEIVTPIGDIQGTFQLVRTPAGRIQPAASSASSGAASGGDVAAKSASLAPQPIVCYPDPARTASADPVLVRERARANERRRLLDEHGGLGHVNGESAGPGATSGVSPAPPALGRATLRWKLFE